MLKIALWIGIALCGVAVLGLVEYFRASKNMRISGQGLRTFLPIAGLMLLMAIAGGMAVLFFSLYFLSAHWEYALIFGGLIFAFLVVRIREERSFFSTASQVELPGNETDEGKGTLADISTLSMQVGTAVAILVMLVPVLTGGFLIYMVLDFISGKITGGWAVLLPIVVVAGAAIYWTIRTLGARLSR